MLCEENTMHGMNLENAAVKFKLLITVTMSDLEEIANSFSSLLLSLVEQRWRWENCAENREVSTWQRASVSACWSRQ